MSGGYGYYTGIVFRAYTYGTGDAVVRGGRYDHLLEKFGKETPSIGFAIIVDGIDERSFKTENFGRHDKAEHSLYITKRLKAMRSSLPVIFGKRDAVSN